MTTKRLLVIGVLLAAAFVRPAGATSLSPGGSVVPSSFNAAPGTLLATISAPFTSSLGASDFSGTAIESVYLDSGTGFLDFVYQFSNGAASGQAIEQMSDSSYNSFTTDVQLDVTTGFGAFTAGGASPLSANRSASGKNVAWQFGGIDLAPGATSGILMIKTNATTFGPGNVSFINEGTATLTNFFAPAVPEPGTFALLGTGLLGLLGVARRRKSA